MTRRGMRLVLLGAACTALMAAGQAEASLARNPAGSKNMGEKGVLIVDTATGFETDPDGKLWTLELGAQYQIHSRVQFLVETIPLLSLMPNGGETVTDLGDTDVTLSALLVPGTKTRPSVVLGGRVKLPTAQDEDLGTKKADYAGLMVLGVERGELEVSLEAEYVTFGQPGGVRLEDQFLYTFIAEYAFNNLVAVYGEVFGNSRPTTLESRSDAAKLGVELDFSRTERLTPYLSFELDTQETAAVRAGIEWKW